MDVEKIQRGLFKDKALESKLLEYGFLKVPFFTPSELEEIKSFYQNVHPDSKMNLEGTENGIHMTTWSGNTEYKKLVASFLRHFYSKALDRIFQNHRHFHHVFISKDANQQVNFEIHQDWSVVDETQYYSVNVWSPLQRVSKENGALWFIPQSHKLEQPIRGAGHLFPDYLDGMEELKELVECVEIEAGEALIFLHATIHGSPPNITNSKRIAACCSLVRKDAPIRNYFQPKPNLPLQVYETRDDFMYNYKSLNNEGRLFPPQGTLIEELESYNPTKIPTTTLVKLIVK